MFTVEELEAIRTAVAAGLPHCAQLDFAALNTGMIKLEALLRDLRNPRLTDPSANGEGYARRDARPTSRSAATLAFPTTGKQRRMVLDYIWKQKGVGGTDDEMIVALGIPHQSVGPRRLELLEGGWIEDSKQRRLTRAHKEAIVWVVSYKGSRSYALL